MDFCRKLDRPNDHWTGNLGYGAKVLSQETSDAIAPRTRALAALSEIENEVEKIICALSILAFAFPIILRRYVVEQFDLPDDAPDIG